MTVASLALALLAAGCNAVSSVLQRRANKRAATERRFGPRLLAGLLRRPAWLLGAAAMIASFLLQASALSIGALAAVEPVLVLELPLTLVLGAWVLKHPLQHRDWFSAVGMAGGLALMIVTLAPTGGQGDHASLTLRLAATIAAVAGIIALIAIGQFGSRRARAALFGTAAGSGFGLTASLMKMAVTDLTTSGMGGLLGAWETYAAIAGGLGSVVLVQAALHAGTLVAAQPGITLLDPAVSVAWGVVVLGEHLRHGPIVMVAAVGAAIIVVSAFVLIRATERAQSSGDGRR